MEPTRRVMELPFLFALVLVAAFAAPRAASAYGACCERTPSRDCVEEDAYSCQQGSGFFFGEGSRCSDVPSCRLGLCCGRATPSTPQGTCDDGLTETECAHQCGKWIEYPSYSSTTCVQLQGATCTSLFVNAPPLAGDCNRDGAVQVNELVKSVNIALCGDDFSGQPCCYWISRQGVPPYEVCYPPAHLAECPAIDTNRSGRVEVFELVQAVNAALGPYCYQ